MPAFASLPTISSHFQQSRQFYCILLNQQGTCIEANHFFQTLIGISVFPEQSVPAQHFFSERDYISYTESARSLLQKPESSITISLNVVSGNTTCSVKWEFSAIVNSEHPAATLICGIGVPQEEIKSIAVSSGEIVGKAASLYKAFEISTEGVWMFETEEPISPMWPVESIIHIWQEKAIIKHCNDNMAKMHGYKKGQDIVGMQLNRFINFENEGWREALKIFIQNKFKAEGVETTANDKEGKKLFFRNNLRGIIENGAINEVWGTQHEITRQHRAEELLQQSELFYRDLIAHSIDGMVHTNDEGLISFASPSIKEILGYEPEEVIGKTTFDFTHPDDISFAISSFNDELVGKPKSNFVWLRLLKKSKEWAWCIVRGHNLSHIPHIGRMIIYFYDDTLRKQAEDALIQSERRFYSQAIILNNVTDSIISTDVNGVITSWNSVIEKITGITQEEAIGKPFREVLATDYSPYTNDQVAEIVSKEGIWKGEISFNGADGEMRYLLHTISLFKDEEGKVVGQIGVGKDITERKAAEAKLQKSELFYRTIISNSLDGIVMADKYGNVTYCGPSVSKISGYDAAFLLGRSFFDFVHPDDLNDAVEAFALELAKQSQVKYLTIRLLHFNGSWVWCTVRGHNLLNYPGVNAVAIYFTNDSKRKEIEDRLRENEKQFRSLIQNLRLGVLLQNEEGNVIICNNAAMDILRVTEEQLLNHSLRELKWDVINEDGTPLPDNLHPFYLSVQNKKPVLERVIGISTNGILEKTWLLVNVEPVLGDDNNIINVIVSFTDITEQKKLSQKLIDQEVQKQKQITQATIDGQEKERQEIGKELHDNINQHLTTTRLYLEVAKDKASGEIKEMIEYSHKNLVSIIQEIRQLSQSLVPPTLGDIGLIESIQDLCDALKRVHTFTVEFYHHHFNEQQVPENIKLTLFRIIQEQINNIVRHSEADKMQIWLQTDAEYISLTVYDNGKGFNPASAKKGQGFKNITNRAALFNGIAEIEAMPGKGCKVNIIIPVN